MHGWHAQESEHPVGKSCIFVAVNPRQLHRAGRLLWWRLLRLLGWGIYHDPIQRNREAAFARAFQTRWFTT